MIRWNWRTITAAHSTQLRSQRAAPAPRRGLRLTGALALSLAATVATGAGRSAVAQTFTPIRPPAAPLVTRGPYVNVWLQNTTGVLPGTWPTHWDGTVKAITGIAFIDGKPFLFLGAPVLPAGSPTLTPMAETTLTTTATQSVFTFNADGVNLTVDFLSPVEATDLQRLSIPLSDIIATAQSSDGAMHNVSLYFDISAEWTNGDEGALVSWAPETIPLDSDGTSVTGDLAAWTAYPTNPQVLTQTGNFADWGTSLWATKQVAGLTVQSGQDIVVRSQFATTGTLANTNDTNQPRAINNAYPVFAFAKNLGTVGTTATSPFTLLLGRVRDPAINYHGNSVRSLWTQYFPSYEAMLAFAYHDAAAALTRANALDAKLDTAATAVGGPNYAALIAVTLRQAFAATELTSTISNPYLFLEEISSSDNVQTVDVLFPASPVFLYMNPELLRYLLEPVIDYAESGYWPALYSPHDLGSTYPNATGHDDGGGENMPVEETANMLIMADAYMQHVSAPEAATYANAHYALFKQWATYLNTVPAGVTYSNAVDPQYQNQTDDFAGLIAHSVNLALKGIEGLDAFSQIATMAGQTQDARTFRNVAEQGISIWEQLAQNTAGTHLLHTYREAANAYSPSTLTEADSDWSDDYNAYANTLLRLNLIPSSILAEQAAFYKTQILPLGLELQPEQILQFGSSTVYDYIAKADWELWTSVSFNDQTLFTDLVDAVYTYANTTTAGRPFPDLYDPTATWTAFEARPVMGGAFAPLALTLKPGH